MLFLQDHETDNWRIYEVIHEPGHARTEMLYQSWLGGLDRPYTRPRCMATQPVWLQKKRHEMKIPRLQGAATELEQYYLEWHNQFDSFAGRRRPKAEDLNIAFDLVSRPLDLSYTCKLIDMCRNRYNVHLAEDSFTIFLDACVRVDRIDVAKYAMENAEDLGFWRVDENCRKFLNGEQNWYRLADKGIGATPGVSADEQVAKAAPADETEEERLLRELEEEERKLQEELEKAEKENN